MRLFCVFMLLCTSVLAQEPKPAPELDPSVVLNNEAVALLSKGKHEEAIVKLRSAISRRKMAKEKVEEVFKKNLVVALLGKASHSMAKKDLTTADRAILEAKRLDPENPHTTAYEGILAYRRGHFTSATSFLQDALRLDPKLAMAHEFIGMILYKRERIADAIKSWKKAILHDKKRKKHLDSMIAKAKRELAIEEKMQILRSTHFTCKFGDAQNRDVANEVLRMLEDAYAKIGADFRTYPQETLTAILYVDREFRGATRAQGWAAGIYDGKIRVPIRNFANSRNSIRKTLFHEYTHFVVSQICKRVPAWMNEGLAQRMEGLDPLAPSPLLRAAQEKKSLKSLQRLSASFATIRDAKTVRLAYAESLSFIGYLERHFGMSRVIDVLRRLGKGEKINRALSQVYGRDLQELEKLWLADL